MGQGFFGPMFFKQQVMLVHLRPAYLAEFRRTPSGFFIVARGSAPG